MNRLTPPNRGSTISELMFYYEHVKNPVTKCVYRQIIGNRLDELIKENDGR